jgi:thiamine biosynthesis protein ThiS
MADPLQARQSIFVNGQARQVSAQSTVGELAQSFGLDPKRLLVELNGETLARDQWPEQQLRHGDRVEFIRVVAGG